MSDDNVIPFPGVSDLTPEERARQLAEHLAEHLNVHLNGHPADHLAGQEDGSGGPSAAAFDMMGGFGFGGYRFRQPTPMDPRLERVRYVVRVDLEETHPPVWRRLRLASDLTLAQVHEILQIAMGWQDYHLHSFLMGPKIKDHKVAAFITDFDEAEGETGIHEASVRLDQVLAEPGDRLFYTYDFGDNWKHTIKLEKVEPWDESDPIAVCVTGRRACPPEDAGGVHGYQEILEVLAGGVPEQYEDDPEGVEWLRQWLPEGYDPDHFSAEEVNEELAGGIIPVLDGWHPDIALLLRRSGGSGQSPMGLLIKRALRGETGLTDEQATAAVRPYRLLLETVGEGVKLTAAGYLPPVLVRSLYLELGMEENWIGKGNREDLTFPVMELRESATRMGLLRKAHGRLTPTRAGRALASDPQGLLAHIGSRLPIGKGAARDAGMIEMLTAAADPGYDPDDPLTEMMKVIFDPGVLMTYLGWQVKEGSISDAARWHARDTRMVLDLLTRSGLFSTRDADPALRPLVARTLLRRG